MHKFYVSVNTNPVFLSLFRGLMTSKLIRPEEHLCGGEGLEWGEDINGVERIPDNCCCSWEADPTGLP